jgi:hypothetical protein
VTPLKVLGLQRIEHLVGEPLPRRPERLQRMSKMDFCIGVEEGPGQGPSPSLADVSRSSEPLTRSVVYHHPPTPDRPFATLKGLPLLGRERNRIITPKVDSAHSPYPYRERGSISDNVRRLATRREARTVLSLALANPVPTAHVPP